MSNLLNTIIANTGLSNTDIGFFKPEDYSTADKVKPLKDKAVLLPSRIIGSPVEYAKDLTKDIISIGKAVKGSANDHELGRINDLGMKAGSLGIAAYLFHKNPFRLSKTMEVVGFGSFFASMALWPKLAIGLPIKARTGVDFQQEYIDSQGRKKRLYQDPQYVLTDLLPREDLDNIGKKMGVAENIPDRDNFIKQRAHKTATQANTLWMMTAGFATPLSAALTCNVAERFLKPILENDELDYTKELCFSSKVKSKKLKAEQKKSLAKFNDFIQHNKNKTLNDEMIDKLSAQFDYILEKADMPSAKKDVKEALKGLSYVKINKKLLEKTFGEDLVKSLPKNDLVNLGQFMERGLNNPEQQIKDIAQYLSQCDAQVKIDGKETSLKDLGARQIREKLTAKARSRKLGEKDVVNQLNLLYKSFNKFLGDKLILDKFISARIGKRADSFIANQWERICGKFVDTLGFSTKELKLVSTGDMNANDNEIAKLKKQKETNTSLTEKQLKEIEQKIKRLEKENQTIVNKKLENLVCDKNDSKFKRTLLGLLKQIDKYEAITSERWQSGEQALLYNMRTFTHNELHPGFDINGKKLIPPTSKSHELFSNLYASLTESQYFKKLANKFMHNTVLGSDKMAAAGTLGNLFVKDAEGTVMGARSSFYRLILSLDVLKQAESGILRDKIVDKLKDAGKKPDAATVERLIQACKDVALKSTTTDHIEKLTTQGFELSEQEYKIVMQSVFENAEESANIVEKCVDKSGMPPKTIERIKQNYRNYKESFWNELGNWVNDKTPVLSNHTIDGTTNSPDWVKKNNIVGKPVYDTIAEIAKGKYNSRKWMQIFGGAMVLLTGITVGAGLTFGRKDEIEKKIEEESQKNV